MNGLHLNNKKNINVKLEIHDSTVSHFGNKKASEKLPLKVKMTGI